ncbi:hypothetical protein [Ascidiimonas aurantiaca]|uniref:hypothetical protein n=1 Tax=Ascidiimonas aurantiaca TaxID=1685432 RepID=UPI0030EF8571
MRKIKSLSVFFMFLSLALLVSCSNEETLDPLEASALDTIEETTLTVYYKGKQFVIPTTTDANGDMVLPEVFPKELENLEAVENLATVVSGEYIYFFDSEEEADAYFAFNSIDGMQQKATASVGRTSFNVTLFNHNVLAYEHDHFQGKKLNITQGYQLRDLTLVGFNDIMSSIGINTLYQNIYNNDEVALYEHKDFKGKVLKFKCELETPHCKYISLPFANSLSHSYGDEHRGHWKFRSIPIGIFNKWADKVSSINVKFATISVVPPYPSSGGGGGFGGGGGGDLGDLPIEGIPIK